MSSSRLIQRLLRRAKPAAAATSRIDVKPPMQDTLQSAAQRHRKLAAGESAPIWAALWSWMRKPEVPPPEAPSALERCREDFCAALHDLHSPPVHDLLCLAGSARSLRELWHLRAELYRIVACERSQSEADRRLAQVNRHFPSQATGATQSTRAHRHENRSPV